MAERQLAALQLYLGPLFIAGRISWGSDDDEPAVIGPPGVIECPELEGEDSDRLGFT